MALLLTCKNVNMQEMNLRGCLRQLICGIMKTASFLLLLTLMAGTVYSSGQANNSDSTRLQWKPSLILSIVGGGGLGFNQGNNTDSRFIYYLGAEFILDKKKLAFWGFRYYRAEWETSNYSEIEGDYDKEILALFYRLPLRNITVALGPALLSDDNTTRIALYGTLGLMTNITDNLGVEFGSTFFYHMNKDITLFQLYAGLRLNL